MVGSKKKRALSTEDKSKLLRVHELLQWKGLHDSAAALAKEAHLSESSNNSRLEPLEALWSRLFPTRIESQSEEESESDSDASESDLDSDLESSDSEQLPVVKPNKVNVYASKNRAYCQGLVKCE